MDLHSHQRSPLWLPSYPSEGIWRISTMRPLPFNQYIWQNLTIFSLYLRIIWIGDVIGNLTELPIKNNPTNVDRCVRWRECIPALPSKVCIDFDERPRQPRCFKRSRNSFFLLSLSLFYSSSSSPYWGMLKISTWSLVSDTTSMFSLFGEIAALEGLKLARETVCS